jgi:hypothetical protein
MIGVYVNYFVSTFNENGCMSPRHVFDCGEFYLVRGTAQEFQSVHKHNIGHQSNILVEIYNCLWDLEILSQNRLWLVPDCFPFERGNGRAKYVVHYDDVCFGDGKI